MRWLDFFAIIVLIAILGVSSYILVYNYSSYGDSISLESFNSQIIDLNISGNSQFYPEMRYRESRISYNIDESCDLDKQRRVVEAFNIIEGSTVLSFYELNDGAEINVLCSEVSPTREEEGHFIAGEGGPSEVISSGRYNVILSGKISLFRSEKCDSPNIAIHEILHALGFDHRESKDSIMYPVTACDQEIDQEIIDEIEDLYSIEPLGDVLVEKVNASKTGRYLSFEVTILNSGLARITNSSLVIIVGGKEIREFSVGEIDIGTRRILTVENARIPRDAEKIIFKVITLDTEITKDNNSVELDASE